MRSAASGPRPTAAAAIVHARTKLRRETPVSEASIDDSAANMWPPSRGADCRAIRLNKWSATGMPRACPRFFCDLHQQGADAPEWRQARRKNGDARPSTRTFGRLGRERVELPAHGGEPFGDRLGVERVNA